jgi:hypothetical protein
MFISTLSSVEIHDEKKKKKATAGRSVTDGGKARTSPETVTVQLAATSLTGERKETLGTRVQVLRFGQRPRMR